MNFRVDCMYSMLSIVFTIFMTTSKHGIMSRQLRNDRIQCIGSAVASSERSMHRTPRLLLTHLTDKNVTSFARNQLD